MQHEIIFLGFREESQTSSKLSTRSIREPEVAETSETVFFSKDLASKSRFSICFRDSSIRITFRIDSAGES